MSTGYWRGLVERTLGGRRLVVVAPTAAGAGAAAERLRALGATAVFVIAESGDAEPPPGAAGAWSLRLPASPSDSEAIRLLDRALADPEPGLVAALDAFDPAREALVLDTPFAGEPFLAGRRRYGWRRPERARLEDKAQVEDVWRACGVPHMESRVVDAASSRELLAATRELDAGDGVVWAADASAGWNTSGERTWWVPEPGRAPAAEAALAPFAKLIRVTAFVPGVPCSLHVLVLDDDVVLFAPVELVTLRPEGGGAFLFAGASTRYAPDDATARSLRATAVAVATHVRDAYGYRGPLTLDGIAAAEGFVPTEINARFGSGLGVEHSLPDLPLYLLGRCVDEGEPYDLRPRELESLVVGAIRERPTYGITLRCASGAVPSEEGLAEEPGGFVRGGGGDATMAVTRHGDEPWATWSVMPEGAGTGPVTVLGPAVARLLAETSDELRLGLNGLLAAG